MIEDQIIPEIDSYELYLLCHEDFYSFLNKLSEKCNEEALIALEKFIKNKKLKSEERNECYKVILDEIKETVAVNERLDMIFEYLLSEEKNQEKLNGLQLWIKESLVNFDKRLNCNVFRMLEIFTKVFITNSKTLVFFTDVIHKLVELLYLVANDQMKILSALRLIMKRNEKLSELALSLIFIKSCDRQESTSIQNLCYFADEICRKNHSSKLWSSILLSCFTNYDLKQTKQGIFLLNALINSGKMNINDSEIFKKFVIIIEALEENQSHLILPTLRLVKTLKSSENFSNIYFLVCQLILRHENILVKKWGLNFVLDSREIKYKSEDMLKILTALNETYLFDDVGESDKYIRKEVLEGFIKEIFFGVFEILTEVDWVSVPFYRTLEVVVSFIETSFTHTMTNQDFINILQKQIETIPKRVKNIRIRLGVQMLYSRIIRILINHLGVVTFKQILIFLFNINKQSIAISHCIEHAKTSDINFIIRGNIPNDFIQHVLLISCQLKIELDHYEVIEMLINRKMVNKDFIHELSHLDIRYKEALARNISNLITNLGCLNELLKDNSMKILNLIEILENCGMEHLIDDKVVDTLNSIFNILNEYSNKNEIIEQIYWKVTKLILRMMQNIKLEFTFNDSSGNHRNLLNKVQCQILVMQNQNDCKEIEDLLSNMENAFNNSCRDEETQEKIDIFKNVICNDMMWKSIVNSKNVIEIMKIISENLLQIILEGNRKNDFIVDYLRILCLSTKIQESEDWNNFLTLKMEATFDKLNASEKMKILIMFMDVLRELYNNQLSNWIKNMLISKLTDVLMVTKEQQIELSIERSVIKMESYLVEASETTLFDILRQRFKISKFLSEITDADEFSQIIESCMENFSKESKKKLRYFPNSFIHRMKLHCLQPIIFCKIISERTKEILLEELFHINNQPNINYLIEIILARHHSQITEILKGNINLDNLKSPAIKSLITIATMQLKFYYYFIQSTESFLHTIEEKLEVFYDFLLPFTMGQNYSVRTYAQTAILTIYDYFKSLSNLHDSNVMRRVEKTCTIINESVILRNYLKHLDILKQDFRFKLEFSQLFTVDTFYHHIPRITNMSEEIIVPDHYDENCELLRKINGMMFKTFDEKTNHKIIKVQDDLEISSANEESLQMTSINLQQKYVPFKYQIPGEKSLLSMPHKFINDNMQLCLKPRSELIVVASLIDKAPNLGGLARTCEVFGVENFVVHSLTIADNNEFKSLSKTAEKWIKMTEIKRWQVLDYILMMKKLGFAIIGAEQSGKSLPLTESQIPSKSLLLLGNEKEGIPANLLSLLDLTIEIPQMGVVRSLNVHVTGALIIWEYTKQHAL